MGATASAPATLDALDPEEQRELLRNVQLLASRDQTRPGKFTIADWHDVHRTMPPRLATGLWRALLRCGAEAEAEQLDLNAVIKAIVPLRSNTAAALDAHMDLCFAGDMQMALDVAYSEALPWLRSMGQEEAAEEGMARSATGAASLLASAACSAWLLDMRSLQPLPELSDGNTRILLPAHVRALSAQLPSEQRRRWRLLYTTCRDGCSFTRFIALGAQRTPCLVVVKDVGGALFGGFASEPLRIGPHFGGGYGSFLFRLSDDGAAIYRANGTSPNLVYFNAGMEVLPNGLAFGGNIDACFFGLWLRDDLESGRSDGPCSAYGDAPCLATSAHFCVAEIEVWAVEDDPPPLPEEQLASERGENALTAAGVLEARHQETRNFVALATGKGQASASLAPPLDAE